MQVRDGKGVWHVSAKEEQVRKKREDARALKAEHKKKSKLSMEDLLARVEALEALLIPGEPE